MEKFILFFTEATSVIIESNYYNMYLNILSSD